MPKEKRLLTEVQMDKVIKTLAKKIVKEGFGDAVLMGIRTRGVPLAHWLARHLAALTGKTPKVGELDINLYRDDLSEVGQKPVIHKTTIPFKVDGAGVILVDDVLYTGRTIRSALDALVDFGRPKFVKLAVLVDRGWRELPIEAQFVGLKVKTDSDQVIKVLLKETDGKNEVIVKEHFSKRK
ncbi:MAG: bifunctional pyr operon transcriptional regulator/uracil phosphoribosyltransferase PyrR [Deltaproteobacteria bacterium]|nr:bifunctional pyr operon transcriptional regulator/uracil phosphoribosyltransferase PyrR [Deltaproteobacteria bacterium]